VVAIGGKSLSINKAFRGKKKTVLAGKVQLTVCRKTIGPRARGEKSGVIPEDNKERKENVNKNYNKIYEKGGKNNVA